MPSTFLDSADQETAFAVSNARNAKGMLAVRCPSSTGFKTRAARLCEGLRARWTNRDSAYILSPSKVRRLTKLYDEGWDANIISLELQPPAPRGSDSLHPLPSEG